MASGPGETSMNWVPSARSTTGSGRWSAISSAHGTTRCRVRALRPPGRAEPDLSHAVHVLLGVHRVVGRCPRPGAELQARHQLRRHQRGLSTLAVGVEHAHPDVAGGGGAHLGEDVGPDRAAERRWRGRAGGRGGGGRARRHPCRPRRGAQHAVPHQRARQRQHQQQRQCGPPAPPPVARGWRLLGAHRGGAHHTPSSRTWWPRATSGSSPFSSPRPVLASEAPALARATTPARTTASLNAPNAT